MSEPVEIASEEELLTKLAALGPLSEEQRNSVVCALIGHSRIQTYCFGYFNCARCDEQMGDSLTGIYSRANEVVIVGHDCEICRTNYAACTWKDKIFAPDPFPAAVDPGEKGEEGAE